MSLSTKLMTMRSNAVFNHFSNAFLSFTLALDGGASSDSSTISYRSREANTISILNFQRLKFSLLNLSTTLSPLLLLDAMVQLQCQLPLTLSTPTPQMASINVYLTIQRPNTPHKCKSAPTLQQQALKLAKSFNSMCSKTHKAPIHLPSANQHSNSQCLHTSSQKCANQHSHSWIMHQYTSQP